MSHFKHALGIPDWRDATAYPGEETTDREWRWEFLRRRPDYRQAWRDQYDESQAYFDEIEAEGLLLGVENSRAHYYAIGSAPHLMHVRERFGLDLMLAPCMPYRPFLFKSSYGHVIRNASQRTWDRMDERRQIAIVFDLDRPIASQLEAAKTNFIALQTGVNATRHHRRMWTTYLRALDAREAGATFEAIYQELKSAAHLSAADYDAAIDSSSDWAPLGRQLWQQAHDLMFKLAA